MFLDSHTSEWEPTLDASLASLGMTVEELGRFA